MSSSNRPASAASNVEFGGYLDRVYDQNMKESEAAYAAHLKAAKELHQAQIAMMRSKRAVRALNDELAKANATAASATELVDRKRKAADAAADDFESTSRMTRGCYGTEASSVYRPTSPAYSKVVPVYSKVVDPAKTIEATADDEETQLPGVDVEQESQDPYDGGETPSYNPVSKDYVPQNPCGISPVYHLNSPKGYCHITGEPIYSPMKATKPRYAPTSLGYSATSPTYTPRTPTSPPPLPPSPHVLAAAKRACLRWGA